jgi:hypothetical protein
LLLSRRKILKEAGSGMAGLLAINRTKASKASHLVPRNAIPKPSVEFRNKDLSVLHGNMK